MKSQLDITRRFEALRALRGLGLVQMAKDHAVSHHTVVKIERTQERVTNGSLQTYADLIGYSLEDVERIRSGKFGLRIKLERLAA